MRFNDQEIELLLFDRHVRSTILEILRIASLARSSFSEIISQELRKKKNLSSKRRRAISNAAYLMVRMQGLIDFMLQTATPEQPPGHRENPDEHLNLLRFALGLLTIEGIDASRVTQGDFPPEIIETLKRVGSVSLACDSIKDANQRLAVASSMPLWFTEMVVDDRGYDEARQLLHAMNSRAPLTIRINSLKTNAEKLTRRLAEEEIQCTPCVLSSWGMKLRDHRNIRALYSYRKGLFEAQDEGSQIIAQLVAPPPKGKVIDLCAGAGGKTLALAAMMENNGEIIATDIDPRRLARLKPRLRRSGATNVHLHPWGKKLPRGWRKRVDRVLLDAPCSGSGTLRRNPGARWQLDKDKIFELTDTQTEIIEDALHIVRPGGWVIYATCSVLSMENEEVIQRILTQHPNVEVLPISQVLGADLGEKICAGPYMRLGPHTHDSDGFFAAVLKVHA